MKLISHRGNLHGPEEKFENSPLKIDSVLEQGYDCEVDLWAVKSVNGPINLFLGHDSPDYLINEEWLNIRKSQLWIHCKNILALSLLSESKNDLNFFWHDTDKYTITSHSFIWVYPENPVPSNGVLVLPERNHSNFNELKNLHIHGVCSDFIAEMR